MTEDTTGVSITFKAGTGYDAPWVVLHGRDVAHVRQMLLELDSSDVLNGTAMVGRKFHGTYAGANPAHTASTPAATTPAPAPQVTSPPPAFVPDQNAAPAGWGTPQAVAVAQQELGATVVATVPNGVPDEVLRCYDHGGAPRVYHPEGFNESTRKKYSASYRCQTRGCGAWWQNKDGSWKRSGSR
jgi:hypothetical protein